jgi:hypothetical protein
MTTRKSTGYLMVPHFNPRLVIWIWEFLDYRDGKVIATADIPAGTFIPIIGRPVNKSYLKITREMGRFAYGWVYTSGKAVDCSPKIYPVDGVGNRGISLAILAREPPQNNKLNCIYKYDYLITIKNVLLGEELCALHGDDYQPIRNFLKYKQNKILFDKLNNQTLKFKHTIPKKIKRESLINALSLQLGKYVK